MTRETVDAAWVFDRYQQIRPRLPKAAFPASAVAVRDLGEVTDRFDAFVFDSFGVLNVGDTPIPGAAERFVALRKAGKRIVILTNAATAPLSSNRGKYLKFGFDVSDAEIVSSREVLAEGMRAFGDGFRWAVAAPNESRIEQLPGQCVTLDEASVGTADGFVLLSSAGWSVAAQELVAGALGQRPRPLLIGNPDLAAPREDSFSKEPGAFAHELTDRLGVQPRFFGKPYGNAFDMAKSRLPGVDPAHMLMIGDTLHTDILGGAAAGMKTALVTDYGVLREMDVAACMRAAAIIPDYILPAI